MGIYNQVVSGSKFRREQNIISSTPMSGSTTVFDSSYILLGVAAQSPCRVRLYSDSASMVIDRDRVSSSFALNPSVGLVVDTELDSSKLYFTFDPPIIGTTFSNSETWYNISSSAAQSITFTSYPIEFATSAGRTKISVSGSGLITGSTGVEGNTYSPKAFIILSGSASTSGSRLRLYSKDIALVPNAEKIRDFTTEPATGSNLIVDILFDSSSFDYKLVPTLEGYNLSSYTTGENSVGYILQNVSSTATLTITASLFLYSTED